MGNIALNEAGEAIRITQTPEYLPDETGKTVRVPEGTEHVAATKEDYTRFLRSVRGSKDKRIHGRAEVLGSYQAFAPEIERLKAELIDPATMDQHPNFIGSGSNSLAFSINQDNKEYAVRVPRGKSTDPAMIDLHLAGSVLGKDLPHLEQIIAASYENGVTVAEKMPGKEIGDLTLADISHITDEQLSDLVDTVITASDHGISIDPKPSNIFYDPNVGFGIVDYHATSESNTREGKIHGEEVGWMATVIDSAGLYGKPYNPSRTEADFAHELEFRSANLEVMKRFKAVVAEKLDGELRDHVLEEVGEKINQAQETVDNYSNPEWVLEWMKKEKEWQREREERARNKKSSLDGWTTIDLEDVV
jgi:hypothetical protein